MTIRNLSAIFEPRSVVLVGASNREGSVGYWLARNLIGGGFDGPVHFVNPKGEEVAGKRCLTSVAELPDGVDLAVIATPARVVPEMVEALAAKGVRGVVCITAGLDAAAKQRVLDASKPTCLRTIGPNCLGILLPGIGLNASFSHKPAPKGRLAFISQSGALVTAIIDWAQNRKVGFSHVISAGDMTDVDFGDLIDYLAGDRESRAILLYMEALTDAAKFMSAARRAARAKPVVIIKSGRNAAAAKAAMSHTGALAGADRVYEAAFKRAGLLRVTDLEELFEAAEILTIAPRLKGERLMILTNGGGAGVLAADRLADLDGRLAELGPETIAAMDPFMSPGWSRANPVDIIGDSGPDRYEHAVANLMADKSSDALLVMNCPTALASSVEIAERVIETVQRLPRGKPVLTNWLGDASVTEARRMLADNDMPTFVTPGQAVRGFMHLVRHNRALGELMRTPGDEPAAGARDDEAVGEVIDAALSAGRTVLSSAESKRILTAYAIPMALAEEARDEGEVRAIAERLIREHGGVALKVLSDDISHKSDVGGVRLGLKSVDAVTAAAAEMRERISALRPDALIEGFTLEPMIVRPEAHELLVGMSVDATFGPTVMFGAGGTAVEVLKDTAISLVPVDGKFAREMMARTRIHDLLEGYRDRPAADLDAIAAVIIAVSDLVLAHEAIREIDINPLFADGDGVIGLDARVRIADPAAEPRVPASIRPYPAEWQRRREVGRLGEVFFRPIRPVDEHLADAFVQRLAPEDVRMRLLAPRKEFSHAFVARLTQIDYAREMAFVALTPGADEVLGVVRMIADPDYVRAEYAIIVRSDLKGAGLGWALMELIIDYARKEGLEELFGTVLAENTTMISMCRQLGFEVRRDPEDATLVEAVLKLNGAGGRATT
jgi:acetyltransferase